jgi:hypothetical protein
MQMNPTRPLTSFAGGLCAVLAMVWMAAALEGCALRTRGEDDPPGGGSAPGTAANGAEQVDAAKQISAGLEGVSRDAEALASKAADAANEFLGVSDAVSGKSLKLDAVRMVLDACWSRPMDGNACEPPARALAQTTKFKRRVSDETKAFVDTKLALIEEMRGLLMDAIPRRANGMRQSAADARQMLDKLRSEMAAIQAAGPSDSAAWAANVAEFSTQADKVSAQADAIEAKAADLDRSVEAYTLAVRTGIDDVFMLGSKR